MYTEAILSNSTRKLLWFEISKMQIAVKKIISCVIYYNFRHIFVPCCDRRVCVYVRLFVCTCAVCMQMRATPLVYLKNRTPKLGVIL